jgi:predicted RNA-binding Zn ribbon-like protein
MKPGQDFTSQPSVETFHFQHQAHISHRIWNAFDQGSALFPTDAAAELARRAESLREFTESQIERAWQRLTEWTAKTDNPIDTVQIQTATGITVVATPRLNWNGLDIETSEERLMQQFREVIDRVRFRMAAYG